MAKVSEPKSEQHKAISLFSGAGGMDIGLRQAGFSILACVEHDPHCCDTLRLNAQRERLQTQVFESDIRQLDPAELRIKVGLKVGELDLLAGGPPCQSFSQIGKRGSLTDERGLLLFQMLRFAEEFKPKAILVEQVKGLLSAADVSGVPGSVLETLISGFEKLDYRTKYRTLNAAEYGVAQLRKRVFIVAVRSPYTFAFPAPTHAPANDVTTLFPLPPFNTVGQVIAGLPAPVNGNSPVPSDSHKDVTPLGDRTRIHGVPEGSHLAREVLLPAEQRRNLSRKDTTKFLRLSRERPSNTLRCGEIFFHPLEDRYLTPREYLRIHGYPDEYLLCGPIRGRSGQVKNLDQHRQVANSVPPLLARRLAETIRQGLTCPNSSKSSVTRLKTAHAKQN